MYEVAAAEIVVMENLSEDDDGAVTIKNVHVKICPRIIIFLRNDQFYWFGSVSFCPTQANSYHTRDSECETSYCVPEGE